MAYCLLKKLLLPSHGVQKDTGYMTAMSSKLGLNFSKKYTDYVNFIHLLVAWL